MQAGYLHNLSKQNNNNKNCTIFQHKKKEQFPHIIYEKNVSMHGMLTNFVRYVNNLILFTPLQKIVCYKYRMADI